jgi:hypothetical protein
MAGTVPEHRQSPALRDFIRESNATGEVSFVGSAEKALAVLAR